MVAQTVTPAFGRLKQEDHEFEGRAILEDSKRDTGNKGSTVKQFTVLH